LTTNKQGKVTQAMAIRKTKGGIERERERKGEKERKRERERERERE